MTKYVARGNALQTRTQSTLHSACITKLETSIRDAKYGTRANKRESYVSTTKLENRTLWRVACSIGEELPTPGSVWHFQIILS